MTLRDAMIELIAVSMRESIAGEGYAIWDRLCRGSALQIAKTPGGHSLVRVFHDGRVEPATMEIAEIVSDRWVVGPVAAWR